MTDPSERFLDAASALWQGRRPRQQDVLASDFPIGADFGLALLADGMGGHPAGDLAARIVITEVFADLKLRGPQVGDNPRAALRRAALGANDCLAAQAAQSPATQGMGTTLLAVVISGGALAWLSVGDSLLYLWRGGALQLLNTRHCLADELDLMAQRGEISAEESLAHPDRHALTSCLNGAEMAHVDCPDQAIGLQPGDLILLASDGIETLTKPEIAAVLSQHVAAPAADTAKALLQTVIAKDAPEQDNLSLTVIRALPQHAAPARERPALWRPRATPQPESMLTAEVPQ